jgi:hypothetical protein
MRRIILFLALLIGFGPAALCSGQDFVRGELKFFVRTKHQLEITPSRFSVGHSPQSFLQNTIELNEGNAAPIYYRACLTWCGMPQTLRDELSQNWERWYTADLEDFPKDEVAEYLQKLEPILKQIKIATSRKYCDWDRRLEQLDFSDFIEYDMRELSTMRNIGHLIRLQTRVHLVNGNFDEALSLLQQGFKMAFDASKPIMVSGLVGESIASMCLKSIMELAQTTDAPNYSLALQSLPFPLIEFQDLVGFEFQLVENGFRLLQNPEQQNYTTEEWKEVYSNAMVQMDLIGDPEFDITAPLAERESRTALVMAQLYPAAKRELIAAGWEASKVESLPVGQVVAIQTKRVWDETKSLLKNIENLPTEQAVQEAVRNEELIAAHGLESPTARGDFPISAFAPSTSIANSFLPSGARRINRQIALMKATEQLRDFAAKHGELPNAEQFQSLGTARDPSTNQPFDYERSSATNAVLQTKPKPAPIAANNPNYRHIDLRFEISLKN